MEITREIETKIQEYNEQLPEVVHKVAVVVHDKIYHPEANGKKSGVITSKYGFFQTEEVYKADKTLIDDIEKNSIVEIEYVCNHFPGRAINIIKSIKDISDKFQN